MQHENYAHIKLIITLYIFYRIPSHIMDTQTVSEILLYWIQKDFYLVLMMQLFVYGAFLESALELIMDIQVAFIGLY